MKRRTSPDLAAAYDDRKVQAALRALHTDRDMDLQDRLDLRFILGSDGGELVGQQISLGRTQMRTFLGYEAPAYLKWDEANLYKSQVAGLTRVAAWGLAELREGLAEFPGVTLLDSRFSVPAPIFRGWLPPEYQSFHRSGRAGNVFHLRGRDELEKMRDITGHGEGFDEAQALKSVTLGQSIESGDLQSKLGGVDFPFPQGASVPQDSKATWVVPRLKRNTEKSRLLPRVLADQLMSRKRTTALRDLMITRGFEPVLQSQRGWL